jgi:hypothetical protein
VFTSEDKEAVKEMDSTPIHQTKKFMDILLVKSEDEIDTFFQHLKTADPDMYFILYPEEEPKT